MSWGKDVSGFEVPSGLCDHGADAAGVIFGLHGVIEGEGSLASHDASAEQLRTGIGNSVGLLRKSQSHRSIGLFNRDIRAHAIEGHLLDELVCGFRRKVKEEAIGFSGHDEIHDDLALRRQQRPIASRPDRHIIQICGDQALQ